LSRGTVEVHGEEKKGVEREREWKENKFANIFKTHLPVHCVVVEKNISLTQEIV
jgi:hypothetical protein